MAVSVMDMGDMAVVYDADADEVAENDVRGGPCTVYGVAIDNSQADAAPMFLKLYDNIAPTVGTTDPDEVIPVEGNGAGDTETVNDGDAFILLNGSTGIPFTIGLSFAVTDAGGTAGAGAPGDLVKVALLTS
jgi:hypothetical protein